MSTSVQVDMLPYCDFCVQTLELHERKRKHLAVYDFKTSQGPWANGCHKHYMEHRMFETLGTGKGQKLFLASPSPDTRVRPVGEHLQRYHELLKEHGTIEAVLDHTDELGIG